MNDVERLLRMRLGEQEAQIATLKSKVHGVENAMARMVDRLDATESDLQARIEGGTTVVHQAPEALMTDLQKKELI